MTMTSPPRLHPARRDPAGPITAYWFSCPGCGLGHLINLEPGPNGLGGELPVWSFNGDMIRPTFTPEVLVQGLHPLTEAQFEQVLAGEPIAAPGSVCHFNVRDGRIEFFPDSTHTLAGQTVDLKEIEP